MNELKRNEKILIMMSTYNGEKYLEEQLESCLNQENVEVDLLIRDDGSSDNTVKIIEKYKQKYSNIEFYQGENLGPAKSFMDLIEKAGLDYTYYSFADQDDVWHKDKLDKGIKEIGNDIELKKPVLYYCAFEMVEADLKHICTTFRKKEYATSLERVLNGASGIAGCTMIINNFLMKSIKEQFPKELLMHDIYIHEVCLALNGKVIADSEVYMKHRLHGNNATKTHNFLERLQKMVRLIMTDEKCLNSKMAKEIIDIYGNRISQENMKHLSEVAYYKKNLKNRYQLLRNQSMKELMSKREYRSIKIKILLGIF